MDRITALVKSFAKEEDGALVTEYGMLIVVVVIAMAAVLVIFRGKISDWFNGIADDLPTS